MLGYREQKLKYVRQISAHLGSHGLPASSVSLLLRLL